VPVQAREVERIRALVGAVARGVDLGLERPRIGHHLRASARDAPYPRRFRRRHGQQLALADRRDVVHPGERGHERPAVRVHDALTRVGDEEAPVRAGRDPEERARVEARVSLGRRRYEQDAEGGRDQGQPPQYSCLPQCHPLSLSVS
jgi:hypothetical protein